MNRAVEQIEKFFQHRYDKDAIFLPSGRLALYLAFREWLRPGERLLLSPVNDDVVFFTVLAAGLVPVIAPLDPQTGNLDVNGIDETTWKMLAGVMTTNLYGIPDRMERLVDVCRHHGLLLIEDACQALDTHTGGRLVGSFSSIAVFSLTKHLEGVGGILAFSETARRSSLLARAAEDVLHRSFPGLLQAAFMRTVRSLAESTRTLRTLRAVRRRFVLHEPARNGHRMPYVADEVLEAQKGGLRKFDRWLRTDNSEYRTACAEWELASTVRQLEHFDDNRQRRIEGSKKLLELGFTPKKIPLPADSALFRVPLFVRDRERVRHQLLKSENVLPGSAVGLDYIYDPPLDIYASSKLAERLPSSVGGEAWSENVLPVNPLHADQFLLLLNDVTALEPADLPGVIAA